MRRVILRFSAALALILLTAASEGKTYANAPVVSPADETPAKPGDPTGQPSTEALKKEFSQVIEAQLAAFRAGEYDKAYAFAASQIKDMFPVENFKEMVEAAYPVIAHSTTAEFGLAIDTGDEAVINVRVENADKKSVLYQYTLHKEEGTWKISGVSEVKSSGLSV